jgi:hypothetical protein
MKTGWLVAVLCTGKEEQLWLDLRSNKYSPGAKFLVLWAYNMIPSADFQMREMRPMLFGEACSSRYQIHSQRLAVSLVCSRRNEVCKNMRLQYVSQLWQLESR